MLAPGGGVNSYDGTVVTTDVVTRTEDFAMDMRPFGTAGQVTFGISRIGGINWTQNKLEDADGNELPTKKPNEFGVSVFIGGVKDNTNLKFQPRVGKKHRNFKAMP